MTNPYAPPQSPPEPPATRAISTTPPGDWLKWAYAAIVMLGTTLEMVLLKARRLGLDRKDVASLLILLACLALLEMIVATGWVYASWSSIPREHRGQGMSSAGAAGRLLIPFYNFYWAFVVQMRFCRALDDSLATSDARAPRGLAMLAAALFFAPTLVYFMPQLRKVRFLFGIASDAVWFLYMHACDVARGVLHEERARAYARGGAGA